MSLGEIIKVALLDTAIGMGTVFAVLILVLFCIWLLGKACYRPEKTEPVATPAEAAPAAPVAQAASSSTEDGELDPQLAAVIAMVAINEFLKEHDTVEGYVVRNVRRSAWKHTL